MDNFSEGKDNNSKIDPVTPNLVGPLAREKPSKETSKMCIKHPKLVKILNTVRQISPQRLARDKEQPVSGWIQDIMESRLDKRVELASPSSDSSPNQVFRQFKAKLEDSRNSVVLNLRMNSRFMKARKHTLDQS